MTKQTNILGLVVALGISLSVAAKPAFAQSQIQLDDSLKLTATQAAEMKKVFPYLTTDFMDAKPSDPLEVITNLPSLSATDVNLYDVTHLHEGEKVLPVIADEVIGISTFFTHFHPGIDLRAKLGTDVRAMLPGIVVEIGFEKGGYGNYIVLAHKVGNKVITSLYAHLKEIDVQTGASVDSGSVIGAVGLTGHTTGPHLHFEIHETDGVAVDPVKFFAGNSIALK